MEVTLAGAQISGFWTIMQSIFGKVNLTQKSGDSESEVEEATSSMVADTSRVMFPDVTNMPEEGDDLDAFIPPATQHAKLDKMVPEASSTGCVVHLKQATLEFPRHGTSPLDTGILLECCPA